MRTLALPTGTNEKGRPAVGLLPEPSNKTVFDDIALAHREIYALYEIAQAMGTSLGVADTMALISSKLSNLVPFSCCALFLHNEELETLRCRFATGIDAEVIQQISVKSGLGLTGWVARNRRTLVNARPSADLEAAGIAGTTSLQSALVCPLVFNERFIGTLSVYHIDAGCYTDDHRRLLDRVCEQAAAVIYNSIVFEQTQEDSLTDPLTGLPNTRFMFMHLTRELARAERLKSEVSLLVMDLDTSRKSTTTTVTTSAIARCASWRACCARPSGPTTSACATPATSSSWCCRAAVRRRQSGSGWSCRRPSTRSSSRRGRASGCSSASASARPIFPHDGNTYETLLATADSRMYQRQDASASGRLRQPGTETTLELRRPRRSITRVRAPARRRRACCSYTRGSRSSPGAARQSPARRNAAPVAPRISPIPSVAGLSHGRSWTSSHADGRHQHETKRDRHGPFQHSRSSEPRMRLRCIKIYESEIY